MEKPANNNEINLLDAIEALTRYKKVIVALVFSITLISLGVSLIWPQTFRSTSIVMPPVQQQSIGGLPGVLGGMLPMNLGGSTQVNPEIMITILNSRSLRVELIEAFNLFDVYGSEVVEELLMKLNEAIKVEERREGGFGFNPIVSIQISVLDGDPERAQQMNAFLVQRLEETINELNQANKEEQFTILEERYLRNLSELEEAELRLKEFQETYGIIEVEEQARAIVGNLAALKSDIVSTEVQLRVLEQSFDQNNAAVVRVRRTLAEMNRQYERLSQRSENIIHNSGPLHPVGDIPGLALEYYRLFRDVTIQNRILETIYPQYDIQKLQLRVNRRGLQVLSEPHLPTYKDGPRRAFIVLGGMVFSIFLSFLIVFYLNTVENGKKTNSENYRKINQIKSNLSFRSK
ncbi:MAG: hypothetical protein JJU41_10260 [Bacteroidetes bacterium]|nr:hypothetical protein [Bacteroidota bacterium]